MLTSVNLLPPWTKKHNKFRVVFKLHGESVCFYGEDTCFYKDAFSQRVRVYESDTIPRKMFVFLRKSNTFLQRNLIHSEKLHVFVENGWPIRAIVKKRRPRVNSFFNKLHLTVFAWLGARSVEGRRITRVWAGFDTFRKHFGKLIFEVVFRQR